MEVVLIAVILMVCGVCQGGMTVGHGNGTLHDGRYYESRGYNQGTSRPPSGRNYLDFIKFEEPRGDENGFRIYMRMENYKDWDHIVQEATITVDDGYEIEKILKQVEIDVFFHEERWIDFTKFSCNHKTQSIVVSLYDIHHREKHFQIPTNLIFGREAIIARVEAVSPEDKIQLWTRNSAKSHCFHGGSVTVTKNGRYLMKAELSFSQSQYTFILRDSPGSDCQDVQYDFAITSRYGWNLGEARVSREDNKVSLDLEEKVLTVNTLDVFLFCTSRSAAITEVLGIIICKLLDRFSLSVCQSVRTFVCPRHKMTPNKIRTLREYLGDFWYAALFQTYYNSRIESP